MHLLPRLSRSALLRLSGSGAVWTVLACCVPAFAQAQAPTLLRQQSLSHWGIGTANFSGIAPMGDDRYVVVCDKEPQDGFFVFHISQNAATGRIEDVVLEGFRGNPLAETDRRGIAVRDCEGVAFFPQANTVFISGEGDQAILEYAPDGHPTGRSLNVPPQFARSAIRSNYGFEALSYNPATGLFWTTTETTLIADGDYVRAGHTSPTNVLRLQSFGNDFQSAGQYAYRMEPPQLPATGRYYCYGVSDVCALPDGRLVVMERELNVPSSYFGARTSIALYLVRPVPALRIDPATPLSALPAEAFLPKQLLCAFGTRLSLFRTAYANYEGLCLGRKLTDGRQTLLLICDSQAAAGKGPVHLKDFLKVVVLP